MAARLRSVAIGKDATVDDQREALRASLAPFDSALRKQAGYSMRAGEGNDTIRLDKADNYTIKTVPATDTCTKQCTKLYRSVMASWTQRAA